jgi:hypothetical protein
VVTNIPFLIAATDGSRAAAHGLANIPEPVTTPRSFVVMCTHRWFIRDGYLVSVRSPVSLDEAASALATTLKMIAVS